jgi:hypothetical protein
MILIERLRDLLSGLLPLRKARAFDQSTNAPYDTKAATPPPANPWTQDLERLSCYSKTEEMEKLHSDSGEVKLQLLMDEALQEKAKEIRRQQELEQYDEPGAGRKGTRRGPRTTDATITDTKAWWGQAVATWDPEDAKNLGPQGEIKHPRQSKWFH